MPKGCQKHEPHTEKLINQTSKNSKPFVLWKRGYRYKSQTGRKCLQSAHSTEDWCPEYKELSKLNRIKKKKKKDRPIKTGRKDMQRHYTKEGSQMAKGHMRRCSKHHQPLRRGKRRPQGDVPTPARPTQDTVTPNAGEKLDKLSRCRWEYKMKQHAGSAALS